MPDFFDTVSSVLAVVAHPDDESFGCGSLLAHAAGRGCRVTVCCASLGEAGEVRSGIELGDRSLGEVRAAELHLAAERLGVDEVLRLGLLDSGWEGEPRDGSICGVTFEELVGKVGAVVDETDPGLVVTLSGDDGHRDHTRIRDAVVAAGRTRPWLRVYQWCLPHSLMRRWAEHVAQVRPDAAHLEISALGTPSHEITDVVDTDHVVATRRHAMAAHVSQTSPYDGLPEDLVTAFLTRDHLQRVQ